MNKYELTLLLDKDTTLDQLTTLRREVEAHAGMRVDYKDWIVDEVKTLAYQINGQTRAGWVYCDLWLNDLGVRSLENMLKDKKEVMRYLVMLKEE